jgi:hypothetical protein
MTCVLVDKNTRVSAHETYGGYGHISVLCRILSGVGPIPYTAIGIHTLPARVDFNTPSS